VDAAALRDGLERYIAPVFDGKRASVYALVMPESDYKDVAAGFGQCTGVPVTKMKQSAGLKTALAAGEDDDGKCELM
jgi:hypothetical protein